MPRARAEHRKGRRLRAAVAFWLAGAAIATTGSLLAVNGMAHGILSQPTQQLVGPRTVGLRHDIDTAESRAPTPTLTPTALPSPMPTPAPTPTRTPDQPAAGTSSAAPPVTSAAPQATAGTLLISAGGSVLASCQPGGAYLVYWSPAQGFEAGNVVRGPAAVASVQFEQGQTELTMIVSCSSGSPVAQVRGG